MTKSIACIFWLEEFEDQDKRYLGVWKEALERANSAEELFREVLKFDRVEKFKGSTKAEIILKLQELEEESDEFEKWVEKEGGKGILLISIVWIGNTLYFEDGNFHEGYK